MHCPECGTKVTPPAEICSACGNALPAPAPIRGPSKVQHTMMGVAISSLPSSLQANVEVDPDAPTLIKTGSKKKPAEPASQTILGMPLPSVVQAPKPIPEGQRTLLGVATPVQPARAPTPVPEERSTLPAAPKPAEATLLGVARPGIAPVRPAGPQGDGPAMGDEPREPREMPHELGATMMPNRGDARLRKRGPGDRPAGKENLARRRIVLPPVKLRNDHAKDDKERKRRAMPVIVAAGALAVFAAGFAIFWSSPPPLSARVKATAEGREAIEIECPSCPDGTKVSIGEANAVTSKHTALVPLTAPLVLGDNRLKVALDRPGSGRDESVGVTVHVSFRLRPDLAGLAEDKPTVHVAVEAESGAEITLDGKPVPLKDGPFAYSLDVSADCTGPSDEPATLKRRLPYVVKTAEGRDDGAVEIAVAIVPLRIDAPGPRVVTDSETFVLAGRTMKGAEVLAAGRPIQVGADGVFAQRMSVSAVGSTNIEVRAKAPGMAPRIVPIAVRRVDKLETAAKEFLADKPLGYAAFAEAGDAGKSVIVSGEVVDARVSNHQTVFLLDVPAKEGCQKEKAPCRVRLVHGMANQAKAGDVITAYGTLGKPFAASGSGALPEVEVAFTLPGGAR